MNEVNASPNPKEEEIFIGAIQIQSAADRAKFLDRQCGDDQALRASVEALISNHKDDDFLEYDSIQLTLPKMPGENVGDTIGLYTLLELIGEGGSGIVYRAEQQQPFRRQVALKVIKPGMDTQHVLQRFERERQALAQLQHSSIAHVYDAGSTEKGRPYFVMEFIAGTGITHYADAKRLTIAERLDLFGKVCRAIQYAHEKGIVHRDIKPSNILIATESGEPVPKVIDFGIAKATVGEPVRNELLSTATGQFIGTPAYMSPEQSGAGKEEIDRRTDIYSLGVLLHELLVGCVPFKLDGLSHDDQLRTNREKKPELPSETFKSLPEKEALRIAKTRITEPSGLVDALRGGLDRIIMRCLEKQRDDRYDTANSLAVDIQSWSKNQAHPDEVTSSLGLKVTSVHEVGPPVPVEAPTSPASPLSGSGGTQEQGKAPAASGSATGIPPASSKTNVFPPRIGEGPLPIKKIPPRGGQSLADWFRRISLNEIRRCIVAGMLSSKEFLREVLEPECINVIAEKMADANTHDFGRFYVDDYGRVPKPIREAVSQVIAADDDLKNGVRENMKNAWNFLVCTMGWFTFIAQYYPVNFLEGLNLDLERVRVKADFRARLDDFDPEFARQLVVQLLMHGHVQAALVLIDIFWKHDSAFWSSVLRTQYEQTAVQLSCRSDKMQEELTQQQVRQLQRFFGAKKCADPLDSVFP